MNLSVSLSSVRLCYNTGSIAEQARSAMSEFYQNIITIEPGKRGGKPCIRGLRITVYDIANLAET